MWRIGFGPVGVERFADVHGGAQLRATPLTRSLPPPIERERMEVGPIERERMEVGDCFTRLRVDAPRDDEEIFQQVNL